MDEIKTEKTTETPQEQKPVKKGCFRRIMGCFGCLGVTCIILLLTGVSVVLGVFKSFENQLPSVNLKAYTPTVNTKIYDCKDRLILELHREENRTHRTPFHKISKNMINAVVSIEDKRFFKHFGVDLRRMVGIAIEFAKTRKMGAGASTITQQFARNAFLTREKTIPRKIKEILLAFKIERQFTKSEILEMYLNEIPFGEGTYGIASAAEFFFGKTPDALTISESALLAGCIQLPYAYSPYRFPERATKRRNVVLQCMYDEGYISLEELQENKKQPLNVREKSKSICEAPHFIYSYLIPMLEADPDIGSDRLYNGNLIIKTTIDLDIQKKAEEAFSHAEIFKEFPIDTFPDFQGAMVCMDVKTGNIKAMVGGRNFFVSKFNRASQAKRQPGSLFKSIVYLAAVKGGVPPNKIINDMPREYTDSWTGEIWAPKNYKERYHGLSTLRIALENSYNIVAIELLREIGFQPVIDLAKKVGIESELKPTLSMALGSYEITPLEMLGFYNTVANQGIYNSPSCVLSISSETDGTIKKYEYKGKSVADAGACYILTDMLIGTVKSGTGINARIPGYTIAGKTGTTNSSTDAWFCGFTPELSAIVYFGFDEPRQISHDASGGKIAAPVWKEFMESVLKDYPASGFPVPPNVIREKICLESGMKASDECRKTAYQAFYRGTEPDLECNIHEFSFGENDIFKETEDFDYTNGKQDKMIYNNQQFHYQSFSSTKD